MSDLNRSVNISYENRSVDISYDILDRCTCYFGYVDGPDRYVKHDVSQGAKALEISGGVLYADESGEYYIEGADFKQLLKNPQIIYTGVPV